MNRIVRKDYPVSRLPEELRAGFEDEDVVDVVVRSRGETGDDPAETVDPDGGALAAHQNEANLGGQFSRFKHVRRSNYKSAQEVNDYVNGLRDEWAHRER